MSASRLKDKPLLEINNLPIICHVVKKAKETVLNFLLDNEDSFDIEYTKHANPKPGSYDRADSYIIANAGWKN